MVLDDLTARGIDHRRFTRMVEAATHLVRVRDAPRWLPGPVRRHIDRRYLLHQLAAIAAVEHFTAVLGWWILAEATALDDAGADPEMLALLRWHGAEEVEHRTVAFDAYRAAGGGHAMRTLHMVGIFAALWPTWLAGTDFLLRQDRTAPGQRVSLRRFLRAGGRGLLPTVTSLGSAVPRYLRPGYHPSSEGDTAVAAAYLAEARGVRAA